MRLSKTSRTWWLVFVGCVAAPAVTLALFGLRTIDLERIERRQQIQQQQGQLALLADTRIIGQLLQLERDPPAGATPFTLDRRGTLVFPRDRVYFAEVDLEPPEAHFQFPAALGTLVEEALAAEAQSDRQRALRNYQRLAVTPQLGVWARLSLARMQLREEPNGLLEWTSKLSPADQDSLSPEGTPVMLIGATYVSRMAGDSTARRRPFLTAALAQLRAGRWWLNWQQRKLNDDDVRVAIAATEGGLGNIPENDARLREMADIERTVRRSAPFPSDRTVRQAMQEGGATQLLVTTARSGAAGGWTGVALSGRELSGFLQNELGPIGKAVPYRLAIADSFGNALWGDAPALSGKAAFPLRAVPGWELRAGEPVSDDRRRRFLWYAFVVFLLTTLAFGGAVTIRIARREMELAKQQEDFAASVTHEFKSPITGIRLLMERITGGHIPDPSTIREYYSAVTREADRLERLVNRLLETHRMRSGRSVYRFAPHCIIDIAQNAIANLRPQVEAKRIGLTLKADDVLCEIDLDRTAIQDSIENLIENAIKYSPPETEVVVLIEHGPKDLRVTVCDEGIGIDPADLPRVFDRFYRGRRGELQAVRGTGLGLPLVKAVAEAHGGAVEVKSALGRGSEFCLRIPIRQEETYVPSIDRG